MIFVEGIVPLFRVIVALHKQHENVLKGVNDPMEFLRVMNVASSCAFDTQAILKVTVYFVIVFVIDTWNRLRGHYHLQQKQRLKREGDIIVKKHVRDSMQDNITSGLTLRLHAIVVIVIVVVLVVA